MTIAQLILDTNDVKTTDSGKVEWNSNSLQVVIGTDITDLFLERGVLQVADVAALQQVDSTEATNVSIDQVGNFLYSSTGSPNYSTIFPALGGGVWKLQYTQITTVTTLAGLSDVELTSLADGQALIYDLATEKWINSNIVTSWSTLTGKPRVVQEMTFGSVLPIYNVGFNNILPNATSNTYGNIFLGAVPYIFGDGTYNVVAAPRGLSDLKGGQQSVILTPRTSLHAATTGSQLVNRSLVLGDCGALDDLYASNNLSDVMAIGTSGDLLIAYADGQMHFKFDSSFFSAADFIFNGSMYIQDDTRLDGDFDCNGIADFAGQVTINGNLIVNTIQVADWTDFTSGERGTGWLFVGGQVACWRINPMGLVSFSGTMFANVLTPATVALTFASGTITPSKQHVFSLARTNAAGTAVSTPAVGIVKTDGTLSIYPQDDYSVPAKQTIWLSNISYYID